MTIIEYMVRYIVETRFHGKRNAVAKAFNMHEDNFRRLYRLLSNGHDSPTLLEKALLFCLEDDEIDIQVVLDGYMNRRSIHPATMTPCPHFGISDKLASEISIAQTKLTCYKDIVRLLNIGDTMLQQIRIVCCGSGTDSFVGCNKYWKWCAEGACEDNPEIKCPCQSFGGFLQDMLNTLMVE